MHLLGLGGSNLPEAIIRRRRGDQVIWGPGLQVHPPLMMTRPTWPDSKATDSQLNPPGLSRATTEGINGGKAAFLSRAVGVPDGGGGESEMPPPLDASSDVIGPSR
jgi:hypothetical protein